MVRGVASFPSVNFHTAHACIYFLADRASFFHTRFGMLPPPNSPRPSFMYLSTRPKVTFQREGHPPAHAASHIAPYPSSSAPPLLLPHSPNTLYHDISAPVASHAGRSPPSHTASTECVACIILLKDNRKERCLLHILAVYWSRMYDIGASLYARFQTGVDVPGTENCSMRVN